jgi:hypothetical protein
VVSIPPSTKYAPASVVDQDVERAERTCRPLDHRPHLIAAAQVADDHRGRDPGVAYCETH